MKLDYIMAGLLIKLGECPKLHSVGIVKLEYGEANNVSNNKRD